MSNPHFQASKHAANANNTSNHQEMKMDGKALGTSPAASSAVSLASSMSTAAKAPSQAAEDLVPEVTPWSQFADLQRQQLAWLTECASALFRGLEAMRKTQQEAAHLASGHHSATSQKLRSPEQRENWLELVSAPLFVDTESCEKYWSQMAAASVQAQAEIVQSIYQVFDSEKSPNGSSLQRSY